MSKTASNEHATTDRLSDRAHGSVDQIAKTAGKTEERIRQGVADAEDYVNDAGNKAKQRSDETLHAISTFVGKNPLTSLGLAFAAGTLLSVFRRRSAK